MAFRCEIVTPDQQAFDQQVAQAIVPAHDGQIGLLTGRAPLLVKLGAGALVLDLVGGKRVSFFVRAGVAQMKDNHLTVVTEEARHVEELSAEDARAELAEATARRITDDASFDARQNAIAAARAKIALAAK
jgi:F-type H+-transporting ATPase subunit epsilon